MKRLLDLLRGPGISLVILGILLTSVTLAEPGKNDNANGNGNGQGAEHSAAATAPGHSDAANNGNGNGQGASQSASNAGSNAQGNATGQGGEHGNSADAPGHTEDVPVAAGSSNASSNNGKSDEAHGNGKQDDAKANGNDGTHGKPCDGCVGNADNKSPKGQSNGDKNHGYECDDNNGVGKGNPAHTSNCSGGSINPPVVVVDTDDTSNPTTQVTDRKGDGAAPKTDTPKTAVAGMSEAADVANEPRKGPHEAHGGGGDAEDVAGEAASPDGDGSLPFTGQALRFLIALGALLAAAGLSLRRASALRS
jgi:hypothetical protein